LKLFFVCEEIQHPVVFFSPLFLTSDFSKNMKNFSFMIWVYLNFRKPSASFLLKCSLHFVSNDYLFLRKLVSVFFAKTRLMAGCGQPVELSLHTGEEGETAQSG
jgi:hypothetical protein